MALFFESSSALPTVLPNADYSYYTFERHNPPQKNQANNKTFSQRIEVFHLHLI